MRKGKFLVDTVRLWISTSSVIRLAKGTVNLAIATPEPAAFLPYFRQFIPAHPLYPASAFALMPASFPFLSFDSCSILPLRNL